MRKLLVVLVLLLCAAAIHGQKTRFGQPPLEGTRAKPGVDYPVAIHISGIHIRTHCSSSMDHAFCDDVIYADAVMNGRKIELMGTPDARLRLMPGDYPARLVKDPHKDGLPIDQIYELVRPDRTLWQGTVTGVSE